MWHLLAGEVAQRGIPVRCRTPALDLLTDETGRVTGAVVQSEGSRQQARARRGVVLGRSDHEFGRINRAERGSIFPISDHEPRSPDPLGGGGHHHA